MECPHCKESLGLTKQVMKQELVGLKLTWEGSLVEAKTIGGMIENTRKLLAAAAKEVGIPSDIFMHSIEWQEQGATFNFLVVPRPTPEAKERTP